MSKDPVIIHPYRGYGNEKRFLALGRVIEDEGVFMAMTESKRKHFINSFKRFESDEIPHTAISLVLGKKTALTETDDEGYYRFEGSWDKKYGKANWKKGKVELLNIRESKQRIIADAEIFLPSLSAKFGILSDIDDTVLQTHMNSRMRLRMMLVSFLQGAHQRLPMEGMVKLFKDLEKADGGKNPFFYVSNSPWNIYDILTEFLSLQKFPKGPVMLRDFGMHLVIKRKKHVAHKLSSIRHILEMYPKLPFLFFGDTASTDADYYLQLAKEYPKQVKAIIIRHTVATRNAKRVAKLISAQKRKDIILVENSNQMRQFLEKLVRF